MQIMHTVAEVYGVFAQTGLNTFATFWLAHECSNVSSLLSCSPMCVYVSGWILKRKAAHCSPWVKVQGASQSTLRLPVLSVPYGTPFPPQFDIGWMLVCETHFTRFMLGFSSLGTSHHPANMAEILNFPVHLVHNLWQSVRSLCTNKQHWERIQALFCLLEHWRETMGSISQARMAVHVCLFIILHTVFVWAGQRDHQTDSDSVLK